MEVDAAERMRQTGEVDWDELLQATDSRYYSLTKKLEDSEYYRKHAEQAQADAEARLDEAHEQLNITAERRIDYHCRFDGHYWITRAIFVNNCSVCGEGQSTTDDLYEVSKVILREDIGMIFEEDPTGVSSPICLRCCVDKFEFLPCHRGSHFWDKHKEQPLWRERKTTTTSSLRVKNATNKQ